MCASILIPVYELRRNGRSSGLRQSRALLVLTHVVAQERMLLMRRGADPYRGKWAPPGGYVGHGESVERAAIREVWEEVRVKLECTQLLPYAVASIPAINQVYHIFAVALAKMLPATAVPPESIDVGWFTRQQLRSLDLWEPASRVDHESLFAGARTGHFNFYQESDDFSRMIRRHGEIEYLS